jgi:hypothetical protein
MMRETGLCDLRNQLADENGRKIQSVPCGHALGVRFFGEKV